ncbi:MAG: EAL domain-containing protein [Spirochaetia bacterium]|nr:EAL domain-containing protein [Spirochaetia bacterium]
MSIEISQHSTVMVIEDDLITCMLFERMLKTLNYKPEIYHTAEDALIEYKKKWYPIILTDWTLPGISGLEFCKKARELRNNDSVLVIVTAHDDEKELRKIIEIGADDYIRKPFNLEQIRVRLNFAKHRVVGRVERKALKYALIENESKFRAIFERAALGILLISESGKILECNEAFENMLEEKQEKIIGKKIQDICCNEYTKSFYTIFKKVVTNNEIARQNDFKFIKANKEKVWVRTTISVITEKEDHYKKIIMTVEDISEKQKVIAELRKLSMAVEQSPSMVIITDTMGNIEYVNPKFCKVTGYTEKEVQGKNFSILRSKKTDEYEINNIWKTIESGREWHGEFCNIKKNKEEFWTIASISPVIDKNKEITHYISVQEDVTERKKIEEALRESLEALNASEERYALAAKGANDGLWDWNIKQNTIYLSSRWKSMLGYGELEVSNKINDWLKLVYTEDKVKLENEINKHLDNKTQNFECEYRIRHKDGSYRWMLCRGLAVRNELDKAYRMVGSQTDITDRKQAEEQIIYDAFHDTLTGLPNRALLIDRINLSIERIKRDKSSMCVLIVMDMDRFNVINEIFGHNMADNMLREIADRLKNCLRPGDTIARLGGDEFAILIDDIEGRDKVYEFVQNIQNILKEPFFIGEEEVFVSASMGVSINEKLIIKSEVLLKNANAAMHIAKTKGPNAYHFFLADKERKSKSKLDIEGALRKSIKNNELELFYQPQYEIKTKKIIGVEALLRWHHPEKGLISPSDFIPLAEESGFIISLGDWVFEQSLVQAKKWHDMGYLIRIAINFSASQFKKDTFIKNIKSILQKTKFNPSYLEIEITENILIGHEENTMKTLHDLRKLGIIFTIDDFGTGYSSLSYLKKYPISIIKIDRTFIRDLPENNENAAIVKAIIAMAHSLNLKVIAEGLEEKKQLEFLKNHNCDMIQGFLISKPVSQREVEKFLHDSNRSNKILMKV